MRETSEDGMLAQDQLRRLIDNAPKCGAGRSPHHGYGLFAREKIGAREVVVDFSDRGLFREVAVGALEEWRLRGGKFTALTAETCLISDRQTKYALLNHSRTPNAAIDAVRRVVFALRDIFPGEEVTVDYRLEPMPARTRPFFVSWL